jgi:glutamine synthetase
MDKQRDFVLRTIEERGVKFVRLWFTDVIGTLKSVAIAPPRSKAPSPKASDSTARRSRD